MIEFIDKESLYNDYVIIGMSTRDIAQKYNSSQTNVRRLLSHFDIKTRSPSERTELYSKKMEKVIESFRINNRKYYTKKCEWCNCNFDINYKTKNKKFCSPECRHEAIIAKRIPQTCKRCGVEIEWRRYKVKYCENCREIIRSESQINRIETVCGFCGSKLFVIPSVFHENLYNYCNTECMAQHYAMIYAGENSPTWTGGKRHYQGSWLSARYKARVRDGFKCSLCGVTEEEYGKEMSVHHIKKYKEFSDKYEANRLENLICLCEACHRFVHSKKNINKIFIQ